MNDEEGGLGSYPVRKFVQLKPRDVALFASSRTRPPKREIIWPLFFRHSATEVRGRIGRGWVKMSKRMSSPLHRRNRHRFTVPKLDVLCGWCLYAIGRRAVYGQQTTIYPGTFHPRDGEGLQNFRLLHGQVRQKGWQLLGIWRLILVRSTKHGKR
uniref:Uncharacterized protein n=1 Tax=Anopheles funestus TaxID=62324 RepID=A0A182RGE3_ANOFN